MKYIDFCGYCIVGGNPMQKSFTSADPKISLEIDITVLSYPLQVQRCLKFQEYYIMQV